MITHIIHKAYQCQQPSTIIEENVFMYVMNNNGMVVINSKPAFHAFSCLITFQYFKNFFYKSTEFRQHISNQFVKIFVVIYVTCNSKVAIKLHCVIYL